MSKTGRTVDRTPRQIKIGADAIPEWTIESRISISILILSVLLTFLAMAIEVGFSAWSRANLDAIVASGDQCRIDAALVGRTHSIVFISKLLQTLCGLFLATAGASLVVRVTRTMYALDVSTTDSQPVPTARLATTSPGLVLTTLGVAVLVASFSSRSDIGFHTNERCYDNHFTSTALVEEGNTNDVTLRLPDPGGTVD